MSSVWMEAEGFEKSTEILDAINVLSVHAKLAPEGQDDINTPTELFGARRDLRQFLEQMSKRSTSACAGGEVMLWGADPRLSDLSQQLISVPAYSGIDSGSPTLVSEILQLIDSEHPQDLLSLVEPLRELRRLVQQHAHLDVVGLFGEI